MTISSTTNKAIYTGDGSITTFAYTYRMDNDSDMQVYINDVLQPSGYTVSRNPDNIGGTVTFSSAPVTGDVVTLLRVLDMTQETDYVPYDSFPAESHEQALDKLTILVQQNKEEIDRTIKAPIGGDGDVDYSMPRYDAGKAIIWDDANKGLKNTGFPLQQYIDDAANSASAAAISENNAQSSANNASLSEAGSEDSNLESGSWANEPEDVPVKEYTNGVPSDRVPTVYSAKHWAAKAETVNPVNKADKVSGAAQGDIAELDSTGNLVDSGILSSDVSNHILDQSNPHNVTASQAGAVSKTGDTISGPLVFNNSYMQLNSATGSGSGDHWIGRGGSFGGINIEMNVPTSGGYSFDINNFSSLYFNSTSVNLTTQDLILPNSPTAADHAARKDYVDGEVATRLALSGGTLTGDVSGISPSLAEHLTRKDYVDGTSSYIQTGGWKKFPGGFVIQWGEQQLTTTPTDYNFPIAFPNACLQVVSGAATNQVGGADIQISSFTNTSFNANIESGSPIIRWLAVGY